MDSLVASGQHTGNSQDDALVDVLTGLAGTTVLACLDGLPRPCGADAFAKNVKDRVLDVSALITEFETINATRFADRIDVERVGMIGQSRGAVTTIAALAGSSTLGITPEPRIRAALTMALGMVAYAPSDLARVTVPIVMMAGGSDESSPVAVIRGIFDMLTNTSRMFVVVRDAERRSFGSAVCATMQAAGAVRVLNPRAVLEEQTVRRPATIQPLGSTLDYRSYDAFVDPVDVRPLVKTITGVDVTADNVPRTLDSDDVARLSTLMAVSFFRAALDEHGSDGLHFTRYPTPKYLLKHEPNVVSAETIIRGDASCPPGQGCTTE